MKAIEIAHTAEVRRQFNVDRFEALTEPDLTSISTPTVQNEHCTIPSFNAPAQQTVEKRGNRGHNSLTETL